eukprot:TRINITY_DN124108_c0_g1_i1.p1 TRINITY_DN124108_c0_g1~~TRINITY_DN124108_c0_g1_i1.p1  ORF type:complete len:276 (+),score=60.94 TRINITY_DN124108_c0_g1_i1:55-828(+)
MAAAMKRAFGLPVWVLIGPPGSGKGTYAKILCKELRLAHISLGDVVRQTLKERGPGHEELRRHSDAGRLLPDTLAMELLTNRLRSIGSETVSAVLLDGFPRTAAQAQLLQEFAPPSIAVNVILNDKHILKKIEGRRLCGSCGASYNLADVADVQDNVFMPARPPKAPAATPSEEPRCDCGGVLERRVDDALDIARERLRGHHAEANGVIEFYRHRGALLDYRVHRGVDDMDWLRADIRSFLAKAPSSNGPTLRASAL